MPPACMQKKLKLHSEQRRAEGEGGSDLGKKYLTQELNQDFHESLEQPNTAAAINKNKIHVQEITQTLLKIFWVSQVSLFM